MKTLTIGNEDASIIMFADKENDVFYIEYYNDSSIESNVPIGCLNDDAEAIISFLKEFKAK